MEVLFVLTIFCAAHLTSVKCVAPAAGVHYIGAAIASVGIASYNVVYCRFKECCDDRWIVNNFTGKISKNL